MDVDETDLEILKAIYTTSSQSFTPPKPVMGLANISDELEFGDRLDILERKGYVKAVRGSASPQSLRNGIHNVQITPDGRELLRNKKRI